MRSLENLRSRARELEEAILCARSAEERWYHRAHLEEVRSALRALEEAEAEHGGPEISHP